MGWCLNFQANCCDGCKDKLLTFNWNYKTDF
jgi:hypothetical protein